jgi:hypothetical protein
MTRQHIGILLVILIGLLSTEVLAQPVITIAPLTVGGVSSWTSNEPLFGTPFFSGMAGIDGSLWGITGDSNLAFTLGIDYDSRGWSTVGDASQPVPGVEEGWGFYSKYDFQMNSIGIDLSIRSQWFQAGSEVDIPIYGHLEINSSNSSYSGAENIPKADLNTTIGIFAAANFRVAEWSMGKLNLIMRLDYELLNPISDVSFLNTPVSPSFPYPVIYGTESTGPIFLARLGLSCEFAIWHGTQ